MPTPLTTRRSSTAAATLLLALALAGASCDRGSRPSAGVSDVSQGQVVEMIEKGSPPLILDVRTPEEYASGHVPHAINIPYDQIPSRLAELGAERDQEIIVYCESGRRAAKASETLEAAGFETIRHLEGDMSGWRQAGLPTE